MKFVIKLNKKNKIKNIKFENKIIFLTKLNKNLKTK